MTSVDTLIHARWIVPVIPEKIFHENHSLAIKNGEIVDILPRSEAEKKYVSENTHELGKEHVLVPGMINLHTHTPMTLLRGLADDVELLDWLLHFMWPHEGKWMSPDFVRVGSTIAVNEMLKSGVTCFNDMYFFPDVTAEVIEQSGMRGVVGAIAIQFPSAWASSVDEYFEKGLKVLEKWKNHDRINVVFAPHATYTVDDAGLTRMKELAEKHDSKVHIHLHETAQEVEDHKKQHGGRTPIQRLTDLGLVNDRLIAVHMTQLTNEDIKVIADSGASVVHCPESNLKLGSGICPVSKLVTAGVNVCLGTDGAASNDDLDLLGEMRTAAYVDKYRVEDPALPAFEVLRFGTINGAKALGLADRIGSLEVGKRADVVAIKLTARPIYNPINTLVYNGTNKVEFSWVNGRLLLDNGKPTLINEVLLDKEIEEWGAKILHWDEKRKGPNYAEIEPKLNEYRGFTKETAKESLEKAKAAVTEWKNSTFGWGFFAARQVDSKTAVQKLTQLQDSIAELDERFQKFE